MLMRYKLLTALLALSVVALLPSAPALAAPPDYAVTGEACHNHSSYFMGWAQVEADCLTINASTLGEDKGRADLVGWSHTGDELRVSLFLDCLVVERHSDTGGYVVFASGTEEGGTRYALMLTAGSAIPKYWAGSPTGNAPCNAYDAAEQANQNGGAFTAAPLSPDLNQRPAASFTYSCDAYTCTFDASPSFDPDGEIVSYRWKVGDYWFDIEHYSGKVVAVDFRCGCTKKVTLTVVDNDGGAAEYSESVLATSSVNASFTFQCSGLACSFDASASSDENGTIVDYEWTFGDGLTKSSASPGVSHTYASPGGYYVYLRVTDDEGNRDTAIKWLEVDVAYELSAQAHHQGKRTKVTLKWTGSAADQVRIYRDGSQIALVDAASGSWSELLPRLTSTVTYRVCDVGPTRCSNTVSLAP